MSGGCAEAGLDLQARDERWIGLRRIQATIVRYTVGVADSCLLQCRAGCGGKRQHQQARGLAHEKGGYQRSVAGVVERIDGEQAFGKGGGRQAIQPLRWR